MKFSQQGWEAEEVGGKGSSVSRCLGFLEGCALGPAADWLWVRLSHLSAESLRRATAASWQAPSGS